MAQISIRRVDYPTSMFVDLKVYVNNEFEGSISNNSDLTVNDLQPGEYKVYVSALKGIYRSPTIKILITDNDEIKQLIMGPNFSIDKVFPLNIFAQGFITSSAYFITEVDGPVEIEEKSILKLKETGVKTSAADVFFVGIPCLYFITGDFSYPEYYQFIGNLMFFIGGVFSLIIKTVKPKISGIIYDNPSILLGYSFFMAVINSHIPALLVSNLIVISWIVFKQLSFFLRFPYVRLER